MCFELDSLPPIPVLSRRRAVAPEDVTLEAADGNRFAAFAAAPDEPGPAGVVVLPDVRGLYRFYEELALRFAERGYPASRFDYFGRTAGVGKRDDDFEYMEHVAQTTPEGIQADVARRGRATCARRRAARARRSSRSASASAAATRGSRRRAGTASPARSASTARPASGTARPGRRSARRDRGADPRAAGRRRREHHCRAQRRLRRGARRRRASSTRSSSTTARRTASSTAAGGVRRRVRRRVGAGARVHRAAPPSGSLSAGEALLDPGR